MWQQLLYQQYIQWSLIEGSKSRIDILNLNPIINLPKVKLSKHAVVTNYVEEFGCDVLLGDVKKLSALLVSPKRAKSDNLT